MYEVNEIMTLSEIVFIQLNTLFNTYLEKEVFNSALNKYKNVKFKYVDWYFIKEALISRTCTSSYSRS